MTGAKKPDRFAPPLMYAFRAAFRDHDARKALDLKDESGERIIASRRASPRNVVNQSVLKEELAEDLVSLLNTVNMDSSENISQYKQVTRSILNYGLSDLAAVSIDENAVEGIAAELRSAFLDYEPRLIAQSIQVERDRTVDPTLLKIRFNVHAEMLATPVDVPVEFVADLELDSGKMKISRL
jgi:type VI secretion system protein ImpF